MAKRHPFTGKEQYAEHQSFSAESPAAVIVGYLLKFFHKNEICKLAGKSITQA